MKFYISARYENRIIAYEIYKIITTSDDHIVTCHWWTHWDHTKYREYGKDDLQGVKDCDTMIVYWDGRRSFGLLQEVGMAIALQKKIVVIGPAPWGGVFRDFVIDRTYQPQNQSSCQVYHNAGFDLDVLLRKFVMNLCCRSEED